MSLETRYAYAVARIRAMEGKLLDRNKLDRMVESRSAYDALKVLEEAGYGAEGEASAYLEADYELLLREENKKLYELLRKISPEPEAFSIFLLRNDFHNARALLKAEYSGVDADSILVDSGTIPAGRMKLMIRDRNIADMPGIMRQALEECIDTFGRTGDPQTIDILLDRAMFGQMRQRAAAAGGRFLQELIAVMIDLANIGIYFRVRLMKKSAEFLKKVLLSGGTIDTVVFIRCFDEPFDSFASALKYSAYGSICEEGTESVKNHGSLTRWEKLADNHIMGFVKKAKFKSFGIEPLIGYLIARETEIRNVRIVMVGKINNLPNDTIRERLRETYV